MSRSAAAVRNHGRATAPRSQPVTLEQLLSNPFQRVEQELKTKEVLSVFGNWLSADSRTELILSLHSFATIRPLKYFNWHVFETTLQLVESDVSLVLLSLEQHSDALSHAIQSAARKGPSWDREHPLSSNRPAALLEFEQIWHPEYQRYVEHVFNHLIKLPLSLLGARRSRDYLQAPFPTRVQTLADNSLPALTSGYDSIVRNAFSHGNTYFGEDEITYEDRSGTKTFWTRDVLSLVDDLVDNCHGIIAALLTFLCRNRHAVDAFDFHRLP